MNSGKVANAIRTFQNEQNVGVLDLQEKSTAKLSCKSSNRNIRCLNRTILPLSWMTGQKHYHTTLRYSTESMHTPYKGPPLKPVEDTDHLESMPWNEPISTRKPPCGDFELLRMFSRRICFSFGPRL